MPKVKYTCEEYNIIAKEHHDLAEKLRHGKIKLICSGCKCELEEQKHVDDSKFPHKRQMLCLNADCGKIFYRYCASE